MDLKLEQGRVAYTLDAQSRKKFVLLIKPCIINTHLPNSPDTWFRVKGWYCASGPTYSEPSWCEDCYLIATSQTFSTEEMLTHPSRLLRESLVNELVQ